MHIFAIVFIMSGAIKAGPDFSYSASFNVRLPAPVTDTAQNTVTLTERQKSSIFGGLLPDSSKMHEACNAVALQNAMLQRGGDFLKYARLFDQCRDLRRQLVRGGAINDAKTLEKQGGKHSFFSGDLLDNADSHAGKVEEFESAFEDLSKEQGWSEAESAAEKQVLHARLQAYFEILKKRDDDALRYEAQQKYWEKTATWGGCFRYWLNLN